MFKKISPNKFAFLFFGIFVFLFVSPKIANAGLVSCGITATDPCTLCHLIVGIKSIIDWAMNTLLIPLSITAISIAGIIYIISSGNPTLTKQAKDIVSATLIGFALMLGAWLIINTTLTLFSAKENLGIEKTNWYSFSCTTTSSSTGVLPTTTTTPTTTFNCDDFKFQTTQIKAQCNDASPDLQALMLKMKNLLGDKMMITSVSDNNGGGVTCYSGHNPDWKQCTNDSSTECCHHKKSSCHYGGSAGGTATAKSEAIDVSTTTGLTADNIITAAKNSGAGYWKDEAVSFNHIHVSTTKCQNN